jgi:class 3 adenylate cyclase
LQEFVSAPFALAQSLRMQELHVSTLEDRIEADLALGRHDALVEELEALVAEHPYRERLRAQLMPALYRSGRQADALDAYVPGRKLLPTGSASSRVRRSGSAEGDPRRRVVSRSRRAGGERGVAAGCVAARAPAETPERPQVRKTVTVAFCEVTESTTLGGSTDPEALRALLARYFERVRRIVEGPTVHHR